MVVAAAAVEVAVVEAVAVVVVVVVVSLFTFKKIVSSAYEKSSYTIITSGKKYGLFFSVQKSM